jgi:hypothetical protein
MGRRESGREGLSTIGTSGEGAPHASSVGADPAELFDIDVDQPSRTGPPVAAGEFAPATFRVMSPRRGLCPAMWAGVSGGFGDYGLAEIGWAN